MAKLYFRYGTVGSAKTLNLLAVAHNYRQGKKVLILKPKLDTRFGVHTVRTRAGLETPADILVDENTQISKEKLHNIDCILGDESQFFPPQFIDQLHQIVIYHNIPVLCYGLRTDFKKEFFPGSHRLLELADTIEEIKTTCYHCNRKGIFNLKLIDGRPTMQGPQIELGLEEKYLPVCKTCYKKKSVVIL